MFHIYEIVDMSERVYDNVQGIDYDKIWSFIAIFSLDGLM
jgi:hypothetical protein